jgi:imidazolonepropionase-like amidohydrolase
MGGFSMLGTRILYSLSSLAVAWVISASTAVHAQTTALRGARVIDGTGGAAIDNATIVMRDGRIVAIGPSAGTPVPGDAEIVDYAGKTIIPGLISDHSHVGIFVGLKAAPENYNRDAILRQLKQLEAYGVTTVMSLGLNGPLFYELRTELHSGTLPGADLFGADQGIGVVGGQPSAAVVSVGENQISRPDTVELARESIRQMAARKTDMVKIWVDSGGGLMPKLRAEVYSAVIEEAHKNGLRVAAHIYDLDDAKAVVKAGVDVVAHGVRDKVVDLEFIDMMKARSVWYISTIVLDYTNFVYADQPPWMGEPFFQRALHPAVRVQLDDPAYRERTLALPATARNRAAVATNEKNLKALQDAGVQIGFGSDSGVGLRIPGVAEHLELALMVEAGLTPMQAITNATTNAARLLKLDDRGVLASGKLADLVVLESDPTADIGNSRKIYAVWHRGKQAAGPIETFTP